MVLIFRYFWRIRNILHELLAPGYALRPANGASLPAGQQFTATGTSCKKAEQEAARLALCALEARG